MDTTLKNTSPAGIFFLTDALNHRQYTLLLENEQRNTLYISDRSKQFPGFKPRETVFAFNDRTLIRPGSTGIEVSALVFQIKTDEEARIQPIKSADIDYLLNIGKEGKNYSLIYRLSPKSLEELSARGLEGGLPSVLKKPMQLQEGQLKSNLEKGELDIEDLKILPFPPHHSKGAELARADFQNGRLILPVKLMDEWEKPAVLASGFNKKAEGDAKPLAESLQAGILLPVQNKKPAP